MGSASQKEHIVQVLLQALSGQKALCGIEKPIPVYLQAGPGALKSEDYAVARPVSFASSIPGNACLGNMNKKVVVPLGFPHIKPGKQMPCPHHAILSAAPFP